MVGRTGSDQSTHTFSSTDTIPGPDLRAACWTANSSGTPGWGGATSPFLILLGDPVTANPKTTATARKASTTRVQALKAEALDETQPVPPVVIEHRGMEYEIPHPLDAPFELLECDSELEMVRLMVGDVQWKAYKATGPSLRDFGVFMDKVNSAHEDDDNSGN